jgi:hypothetical protein
MRFPLTVMFGLAVAYCADTLLYGGVHAATAIAVAGNIARAVLQGLHLT